MSDEFVRESGRGGFTDEKPQDFEFSHTRKREEEEIYKRYKFHGKRIVFLF